MNAIAHTLRLAAGAAGLAALGACTTLPVTVDANPNASVASCRSYVFAAEHQVGAGATGGGAYGNPLNGDRLRAAIAANLAARGIQPAADRGTADCVVGYAIGTRLVADAFAGGFYDYGYPGWRHGYGGFGYGYGYPAVYNEGRISLDLFDAKSRSAIWHASVNQNVTDLTGPNAELKINAATSAIFSKFPVGAP
jgi:hypothetical protein